MPVVTVFLVLLHPFLALGNDVTEIEKAILDYRKSIRSAKVDVYSEVWSREGGGRELRKQAAVMYLMTCDGRKLRTEMDVRSGESIATRTARRFAVQNGSQAFLRPLDAQGSGESRFAVNVLDLEKPGAWRQVRASLYDPRIIGLVPRPFGTLHSANYDDFVGTQIRSNVKVDRIKVAGEDFIAVEFTYPKSTVRMRVDDKRGPTLVFGELIHDGTSYSISCELSLFQDIWFPNNIVFQESTSGEVRYRNIASVRSAVFNIAIDSDVFTMRGLGVEPGTPVVDFPPRNDGSRVWDGDSIVGLRDAGRSSNTTWPTAAILGLLSIAIALALISILIRRKAM